LKVSTDSSSSCLHAQNRLAARAKLAVASVVAATVLLGGPAWAHQVQRNASMLRSVAGETQNDRFRETMDLVFGPGRWWETSGYRSPSEENRLRLEGAGTVAAGRLSAHSRGTPDAPGAYDAIVYGMSLTRAASTLRGSGTEFARAFVEGAHGPEGAHLHINVENGSMEAAIDRVPAAPAPQRVRTVLARVSCDSIYMRVIGGRRNPQLSACSSSPG
jgi:hypothetical protein